jgi:hypothetical protein
MAITFAIAVRRAETSSSSKRSAAKSAGQARHVIDDAIETKADIV